MIVITSFYAGLIGLFYFALSMNVIRNRWRYKQSLGAGGEAKMERAIRVHGNFAEYVPLIMIMMGFLEMGKAPSGWLHAFGVCLVMGRLLHAYGLAFVHGTSKGRFIGMLFTFSALIGCSIQLIVLALQNGF